jgi:S1-C subfamily serine protease
MNSTLKNILLSGGTALVVSLLTLQLNRPSLPLEEYDRAASSVPPVLMRTGTNEEAEIVAAVQGAEPAVVSVIVTKDLPIMEQYFESPFGNGLGFPFDFQIPQYRQNGTEEREVGGGTAFFISHDGLLMTNRHVVLDEDAEYTVLLNDGRKLEAEVVARDSGNDIALLKVEGTDFPALRFSEGDSPLLGQTVIAIGNALGEFRNTVSVGVISGLSRTITASGGGGQNAERLDSIIQTDAAINRGNSGGPLLNSHGEIIGMNTAVAAGGQNIGFAIPFPDLKRAFESYEKNGRIVRPYLGIRYMPITGELKEKNSLAFDYGVLIVRGETATDLAIVPGSPADKAGLQENDIILEADGEKITLDVSLARIVQNKMPDETVMLKVFSKGKEKEVTVTLEERKQ